MSKTLVSQISTYSFTKFRFDGKIFFPKKSIKFAIYGKSVCLVLHVHHLCSLFFPSSILFVLLIFVGYYSFAHLFHVIILHPLSMYDLFTTICHCDIVFFSSLLIYYLIYYVSIYNVDNARGDLFLLHIK